MTDINCSNDCIYQKEGKCRLESVMAMSVSSNNGCAYYFAKPSVSESDEKTTL
mgnify:CR=1 FL=1